MDRFDAPKTWCSEDVGPRNKKLTLQDTVSDSTMKEGGMTRVSDEKKRDRRQSVLITAGGIIALSAWMVALALLARILPSDYWYFVYSNVEWLGIVSLVVSIIAGMLFFFSPVSFMGVPWGGPWWRSVAYGFSLFGFGLASLILTVAGLLCIGVVLPIKLALEYILTSSPTLVGIVAVIPLSFLLLGLGATVAHVYIITGKKGSLVSTEGRLMEGTESGGTGRGLSDFINVYFFSCFALLGGDFAEYQPVGGCRVVTLASVIVGRLLEVAVISAGINLWSATMSK
jgi:hypothetical protein